MIRSVALLALGLAGCPGKGSDTSDPGVSGGSCDWIRAETPATVLDDDAVTVYCQETTDCNTADILVTTLAVLNAAEAACEDANALNSWETVPNACVDEEGLPRNAVRCWKLD